MLWFVYLAYVVSAPDCDAEQPGPVNRQSRIHRNQNIAWLAFVYQYWPYPLFGKHRREYNVDVGCLHHYSDLERGPEPGLNDFITKSMAADVISAKQAWRTTE